MRSWSIFLGTHAFYAFSFRINSQVPRTLEQRIYRKLTFNWLPLSLDVCTESRSRGTSSFQTRTLWNGTLVWRTPEYLSKADTKLITVRTLHSKNSNSLIFWKSSFGGTYRCINSTFGVHCNVTRSRFILKCDNPQANWDQEENCCRGFGIGNSLYHPAFSHR